MAASYSIEKRDVNVIPSFSLGSEIEIVSQVHLDINEEYDNDVQNYNFVTPKHIFKEKSSILIKLVA